jgi:hypothetical protein
VTCKDDRAETRPLKDLARTKLRAAIDAVLRQFPKDLIKRTFKMTIDI